MQSERMYAAAILAWFGLSLNSGGKTRIHISICMMMGTIDMKNTTLIDLPASPYLAEKKELAHAPNSKGAEVATALNPFRLSRMVKMAANSKAIKLNTICTMSLVLNCGPSGGTIISIYINGIQPTITADPARTATN